MASAVELGAFRLTATQQIELSASFNVGELTRVLAEGDASSRRDALWLLWKLSQDESQKSRIRDEGGLDPLIDMLESESLELRRLSLRTLCNLSFDDRNNVEIRSLSGIGPILDCLYPNSSGYEDVETTRAALRTLCNLSVNDDNKGEIRTLGGLPPIVECLYSTDVRTRRDALRTICNLSIDAENKREILPLGGLRAIIECLESDDVESKRYALASLINLSNDEENEHEIRRKGGIEPVIGSLRESDLETRRFALRCLCNLSISHENKIAIGRARGVEEVLACLQFDDLELRCYALATLMHLCGLEDNNAEFARAGGMAPVLECLRSTDAELRRYAIGALSVCVTLPRSRQEALRGGALHHVVKALRAREVKTRRNAIRALFHLLSPCETRDSAELRKLESLDTLASALTSGDAELLKYAHEVLLLVHEDAASRQVLAQSELDPLCTELVSENPTRRTTAATAMRQRLDDETAKAEAARVRSEEERQRRLAALPRRPSPPRRSSTAGPPSRQSQLTFDLGVDVNALKARLADAEDNLQSALEENNALKETVRSLEAAKPAAAPAADLQREIDRLKRDLAAAQSASSSRAAPPSTMSAESERLRAELAEARRELAASQAELARVQRDKAALQTQVSQREQSSSHLAALVAADARASADSTLPREAVARIDAQLSGMQAEIERLEAQLAHSEGELARERAANDEQQRLAVTRATELSRSNDEMAQLRARLVEAQERMQRGEASERSRSELESDASTKIAQLESELRTMTQRVAEREGELQAERSSSQKRISALEESLADAEHRAGDAKARAASLASELATLQRTSSATGDASSTLRAEVARLNASLRETEQRERDGAARIQQLQRELTLQTQTMAQASHDEQVVALTEQLHAKDAMLEAQRDSLRANESQLRTQSDRIAALERGLDEARTKLNDATASSRATAARLEADLAAARSDAHSAGQRVRELERELGTVSSQAAATADVSVDATGADGESASYATLVSRIELLEETLRTRDRELQSVRNSITSSRADVQSLSEQLRRANEEIAERTQREEDAAAMIKRLEAELSVHARHVQDVGELDTYAESLRKHIAELETSSRTARTALEAKEKQMSDLVAQHRRSVEEYEIALNELSQRVANLKRALEEAREREGSAQSKISYLTTELSLISERSSSSDAASHTQEAVISTLRRELDLERETREAERDKMLAARDEVSRLEAELRVQKGTLARAIELPSIEPHLARVQHVQRDIESVLLAEESDASRSMKIAAEVQARQIELERALHKIEAMDDAAEQLEQLRASHQSVLRTNQQLTAQLAESESRRAALMTSMCSELIVLAGRSKPTQDVTQLQAMLATLRSELDSIRVRSESGQRRAIEAEARVAQSEQHNDALMSNLMLRLQQLMQARIDAHMHEMEKVHAFEYVKQFRVDAATKVDELNAEIATLDEQRADLETQLADLSSEGAQSSSATRILQDRAREAERELASTKAALSTMTSRTKYLEEQVERVRAGDVGDSAAGRKVAELESELASTRAYFEETEIPRLQQLLSDAEARAAAAEEEAHAAKTAESAALSAARPRAPAQPDATVADLTAQLAAATAKVKQLEHEIEAQARVSVDASRAEALQRQLDELEASRAREVASLESRLSSAIASAEPGHASIVEARTLRKEIETLRDERDSLSRWSRAKIEELERELRVNATYSQSDSDQSRVAIERVEADNAKLRASLEQLREHVPPATLHALQTGLPLPKPGALAGPPPASDETFAEELADQRRRNAQLQTDLSAANVKVTELQRELRDQSDFSQTEARDQAARIQALESTLETTRRELERAKRSSAESSPTLSGDQQLRHRIGVLEAQVHSLEDELRETKEAASSKISSLNAELHSSTRFSSNELSATLARAERAEAELMQARSQIAALEAEQEERFAKSVPPQLVHGTSAMGAAQLREMVASLQTKVALLEDENRSLQTRTDTSDAAAKVAHLERELRTTVDFGEQERSAMAERVAFLEAQVERLQSDQHAPGASAAPLTSLPSDNVELLQKTLSEQRAQIIELRTENDSLRSRSETTSDAGNKISALERELAATVKFSESERSHLTQRLVEIQQHVGELEVALDDARSQLAAHGVGFGSSASARGVPAGAAAGDGLEHERAMHAVTSDLHAAQTRIEVLENELRAQLEFAHKEYDDVSRQLAQTKRVAEEADALRARNLELEMRLHESARGADAASADADSVYSAQAARRSTRPPQYNSAAEMEASYVDRIKALEAELDNQLRFSQRENEQYARQVRDADARVESLRTLLRGAASPAAAQAAAVDYGLLDVADDAQLRDAAARIAPLLADEASTAAAAASSSPSTPRGMRVGATARSAPSGSRGAMDVLQEQLDDALAENHDMRAQLEAASQRVIELQTELNQQVRYSEKEIGRLQSLVAANGGDAGAAPAAASSRSAAAASALSLPASSAAGVDELSTLKATLMSYMEDKHELEAQLNVMHDEADAAASKIRDLQSELDSQVMYAQRETAELRESNERLTAHLRELQDAYDRLRERYSAMVDSGGDETALDKVRREYEHEIATNETMARQKILELENELHHQTTFAKRESEQMAADWQARLDEALAAAESKHTDRVLALRQEIGQIKDQLQQARKERADIKNKYLELKRKVRLHNVDLERLPLTNEPEGPASAPRTPSAGPSPAPSRPTSVAALAPSAVATPGDVRVDLGESAVKSVPRDLEPRPADSMAPVVDARIVRIAAESRHELEVTEALDALQRQAEGNAVARVAMVKLGLVAALVERLRSASLDIATRALRLISLLSGEESAQAEVVLQGGVPVLVGVFARFENSGENLLSLLSTIRNVALNDEAERQLVSEGCVARLVPLLSEQDTRLRREASRALRNLAFSNEGKAQILALNGVEPLLELLRTGDADIKRNAMRALSVLSVSPDIRVQIREFEGIPLIVKSLRSLDAETVRGAAGALINLSVNGRNKVEIRAAGGIPALLSCLSSPDLETQRFSTRCIANLAINDDNRLEILKHNSIGLVVRMAQHPDAQVQRYAVKAIQNLLQNEGCAMELSRQDAVAVLAAFLAGKSFENSEDGLKCLQPLSHFEHTHATFKRLGLHRIVLDLLSFSAQHAETLPSLLVCLDIIAHLALSVGLRGDLIQAGTVPFMVSLLSQEAEDVRRMAVFVLVHLSATEKCKHDVRLHDGIRQLVALLMDSQIVIVVDVLKVLFNLSSVEQNRVAFRELQGLPVLVDLLNELDTELLQQALSVIYSLAVDDENEVAFGSLGAIPRAIQLLSHAETAVQEKAIMCLCNLTNDEMNKALFVESEGVQSILQVLQSTDEALVRHAARCMRNVVFNEDCKTLLLQLDAMPLLARLLRHPDVSTTKYIARSICALSVKAEVRQRLAQTDAVPALVSLLTSHDDDVQKAAVGSLVNLSLAQSQKIALRESGGLERLAAMIERGDTESQRLAMRSLANACLNGENAAIVSRMPNFGMFFSRLLSKDAELQRATLSLFVPLSATETGLELMSVQQSILDVSHVLLERIAEQRVRRDCLRIVISLMRSPKNRNLFIEKGGARLVVRCMLEDRDSSRLSSQVIAEIASDPDAALDLRQSTAFALLIEYAQSADPETMTASREALAVLARDAANLQVLEQLHYDAVAFAPA